MRILFLIFPFIFAAAPKLTDFSPQSSLSMLARSNYIEIAYGNIPGRRIVSIFGFNLDVDAGVAETVWSSGGLFVIPTNAQTLNIVSTNANDTSAGTGARTLLLTGLNDDYSEITEEVTLNGTTNVTTTKSFIHISRMEVTLAGSGFANAGVISAIQTGSGIRLNEIPATYSISQQPIYRVPKGVVAQIDSISTNIIKLSGTGVPEVTAIGIMFDPEKNTKYKVYLISIDANSQNLGQINPLKNLSLTQGVLFYWDVTTDVSNTEVNINYHVLESTL